MAVSAKMFGKAILSAFNKEIDWNSDSIKCALFTDAHAPDQDVDQYYDAAHGMTEVSSGNGYTTGGAAVATPTADYTAGTNVIKLDGADVGWTMTASLTCRYAVIYDDTPVSNKPLLAYVDFGENRGLVGAGTFNLAFDAGGIATITVS